MKHKILIFDSSVLCVYLRIPGKEACTGGIPLTYEATQKILEDKEREGWKFVLPVACVIETGNHIAQCRGDRFQIANNLVAIIHLAIQAQTPWIVFQDNLEIWHKDNVSWLDDWAHHATAGLSMGDRTIKMIADDYSRKGYNVEIFTCDAQLRAYQPTRPALIPRRRQ